MDQKSGKASIVSTRKCEHCDNPIPETNNVTIRTVSTYEDVRIMKHFHLECYINACKNLPNTPYAAQFKNWIREYFKI